MKSLIVFSWSLLNNCLKNKILIALVADFIELVGCQVNERTKSTIGKSLHFGHLLRKFVSLESSKLQTLCLHNT